MSGPEILSSSTATAEYGGRTDKALDDRVGCAADPADPATRLTVSSFLRPRKWRPWRGLAAFFFAVHRPYSRRDHCRIAGRQGAPAGTRLALAGLGLMDRQTIYDRVELLRDLAAGHPRHQAHHRRRHRARPSAPGRRADGGPFPAGAPSTPLFHRVVGKTATAVHSLAEASRKPGRP